MKSHRGISPSLHLPAIIRTGFKTVRVNFLFFLSLISFFYSFCFLSKCTIIIFVLFLLHVSTTRVLFGSPVYPCKELVSLEPCCEDLPLGPVFSYCGPLSWNIKFTLTGLRLQEDFYNPLFWPSISLCILHHVLRVVTFSYSHLFFWCCNYLLFNVAV